MGYQTIASGSGQVVVGAYNQILSSSNDVFVIGGGTAAARSNIAVFTITGSQGGGVPVFPGLGNFANDAAANAGGVPIGGLYRNGSNLYIRVS